MRTPKQEPPSIIVRGHRGGRVEFYRDTRNQWRWRCVAKNGRILATSSEGYVRRIDCIEGFELANAIMEHCFFNLPLDIPSRYPVEYGE